MEIIKALITAIFSISLGLLIFEVFSHFYDFSGNRHVVREPFFLSDKVNPYYVRCHEILAPCLSQDFAKRILFAAEKQLKDDYKQYKKLLKEQSDFVGYEYYRDVCTITDYAVRESWAVLFIHYHLNHRTGQSLIYVESESRAVTELRVYVEKKLEKIESGNWLCPDSFVDAFWGD